MLFRRLESGLLRPRPRNRLRFLRARQFARRRKIPGISFSTEDSRSCSCKSLTDSASRFCTMEKQSGQVGMTGILGPPGKEQRRKRSSSSNLASNFVRLEGLAAVSLRRPQGHKSAGTWAARLRAMLPRAVAKDRRYFPTGRERENDCSLNAALDFGLSGDGASQQDRTVLAIKPRQHSGNSGFLFLSSFTDAVQSKRGLERTELFLGGFFSFPSFFLFYSIHLT